MKIDAATSKRQLSLDEQLIAAIAKRLKYCRLNFLGLNKVSTLLTM